jgi:hypothetical protein
MPKRGKTLMTAGRGERAEPIVTYSRLSPEETASGRIEPHFTAVRVDARGRQIGAIGSEDIDALPLVEAPSSGGSFDPVAGVSAGEVRPTRRRGPGVLALAGVLALVAGAGVLAAVYNGAANLDIEGESAPVAVEAAAEPTVVAAAEPVARAPVETQAVDATGRSVRVVSADRIPPPFTETAALAPAGGEAAATPGQAGTHQTATADEPPGRIIADPPLPRLRPVTASFNPPQSATPESEAMAAVGLEAGVPAPAALEPATTASVAPAAPAVGSGSDVDAALASVDRILAGQRAAGDYAGTGDDEFYAPVEPLAQPLPYPVLEPATNGGVGQASPNPAGERYGPYYPGQEPWPGQPGFPATPQPLQPGVDLAADAAPAQPWWLPKRRALVIPNAPVPPAEVPNAPGGTWGAW